MKKSAAVLGAATLTAALVMPMVAMAAPEDTADQTTSMQQSVDSPTTAPSTQTAGTAGAAPVNSHVVHSTKAQPKSSTSNSEKTKSQKKSKASEKKSKASKKNGKSAKKNKRFPARDELKNYKKAEKWAKSSKVRYIRNRESRNTYSINTGNGYYGAYQFAYGTWKAMGGQKYAKTADKAPAYIQDYIAYKLYKRAGWSPWGG